MFLRPLRLLYPVRQAKPTDPPPEDMLPTDIRVGGSGRSAHNTVGDCLVASTDTATSNDNTQAATDLLASSLSDAPAMDEGNNIQNCVDELDRCSEEEERQNLQRADCDTHAPQVVQSEGVPRYMQSQRVQCVPYLHSSTLSVDSQSAGLEGEARKRTNKSLWLKQQLHERNAREGAASEASGAVSWLKADPLGESTLNGEIASLFPVFVHERDAAASLRARSDTVNANNSGSLRAIRGTLCEEDQSVLELSTHK